MSQQVSISQAARNSLATWLASELGPVTGLTVEPRWVERDKSLGSKVVTIIDAGPRSIDWLQPEILKTVNVDLEGATVVKKVDATWQLGQITQPVQLDVWAPSDVELDDIAARLDASLNKGERGLGLSNVDLFCPGLLLNLGDGWAPGIVDFLFESPEGLETPDSVGQGEWRLMYRGRATAMLVQVARSSRIARILLEQRLRERDPIDTADPPDETIILPTS